jgi:hypothetical protein
MNETHTAQQLLSQAGIETEEVFSGMLRDCPVCGSDQQLAA